MKQEPNVHTLAETENFVVWVSEDQESGETLYHLEMASVTLHFFEDEWEEFVALMLQAVR